MFSNGFLFCAQVILMQSCCTRKSVFLWKSTVKYWRTRLESQQITTVYWNLSSIFTPGQLQGFQRLKLLPQVTSMKYQQVSCLLSSFTMQPHTHTHTHSGYVMQQKCVRIFHMSNFWDRIHYCTCQMNIKLLELNVKYWNCIYREEKMQVEISYSKMFVCCCRCS